MDRRAVWLGARTADDLVDGGRSPPGPHAGCTSLLLTARCRGTSLLLTARCRGARSRASEGKKKKHEGIPPPPFRVAVCPIGVGLPVAPARNRRRVHASFGAQSRARGGDFRRGLTADFGAEHRWSRSNTRRSTFCAAGSLPWHSLREHREHLPRSAGVVGRRHSYSNLHEVRGQLRSAVGHL